MHSHAIFTFIKSPENDWSDYLAEICQWEHGDALLLTCYADDLGLVDGKLYSEWEINC